LTNRRLDPATFQALQALVSRGQMRVGPALASAIRERRELLGKSVRALADHFQVGEDTLAEIEEGESSIPAATLVKLAQALEVDLVWFIEREPTFFADPKAADRSKSKARCSRPSKGWHCCKRSPQSSTRRRGKRF
jgi:transcriptional regulator with XRE-family HTH domain